MSNAIEEFNELERVRSIVWKGLGLKSARQLAEEAGIPPETIMRVKRELIESVDILSIQEKRMKLLVDLQDIAQRTQDDYDKAPFEFKAGIMNAASSAIDKVLKELSRVEKQDQSKVDALNALRVRELVDLMNEVVTSGVKDVAARYDLDEDDIFEIFNSKLVEAAERRDVQ